METPGPQALSKEEFAALVLDETIRRQLRKTPQQRLDDLVASLRFADARGLSPKRDRAAHERKLLQMFGERRDLSS